MFLLVF